jgi:hypothetical protein
MHRYCNHPTTNTLCQFHTHLIFLYENDEKQLWDHIKDIVHWIKTHPNHIYDEYDFDVNSTDITIMHCYLKSLSNDDRFIYAYEEGL